MTTTPFYAPSNIAQVEHFNSVTGQPSINWNHSELAINTNSYAVTQSGLYTISGMWQEKFRSETSELWCTGIPFPQQEGTISGIEVQLNVHRVARVQDLVIQLTLNGELIGENRASDINPVQSNMYTGDYDIAPTPNSDYHVYGSDTDMWGTTLTAADINDASFGVVISFQSNSVMPHRDLVYVDQLAVRITYA